MEIFTFVSSSNSFMMLERFQAELKKNNWENKKIILALSGGADSMVMADLFRQSVKAVAVAHCNYGLRGAESDGDEQLVETWAAQNHIPFYKKDIPLHAILEKEGGNLQDAARVERYEWFELLRSGLKFDFIAVAHHRKDAVETMLINFFKGTGITGMHGILPQYGNIIRPMLSFTKEEILDYATTNHIPWRMDSSNKKNDYVRNKIRNQLLPLVQEMFPNVLNNLTGNLQRFSEAELLYRQSVDLYRKKLLEERNKDWYISVLKLRHCRPLQTIFFELLKPFGFRAAQLPQLLHLLDSENGKVVSSPSHRIIRNRNFLIITALPTAESTFVLIEEDPEKEKIVFPDFILEKKIIIPDAHKLSDLFTTKAGAAYIDISKVTFPLICRPWKQGDYFYPLGMNRKKKKVSRFLIDQKLSLPEKEKVWVLEQDKKIIWVVGMRLDDRFKITDATRKMIYCAVHPRKAE